MNKGFTKRSIAALGLTGSLATLALLIKQIKDKNPADFIVALGHTPFLPSMTGFIVLVVVTLVGYSSSNWLNFISNSGQEKLRARDTYNFDIIDKKVEYQLQLFPVYAVTGPLRILITYGFWQFMRNHLIRVEGGAFVNLAPSALHITQDWSAPLETWFNLAGLVFFLSSVMLEWISSLCVRSKNGRVFWIGNIAGLALCPLVLGVYDSHFIEDNGLYLFRLVKHASPSVTYWIYISLGAFSVFLSTFYLVADNSRDFALDRDLFQLPVFNTIFTPISLVLNRKRDDTTDTNKWSYGEDKKGEPVCSTPTLFICVTLWHENKAELNAMLGSLVKLASSNKKKLDETRKKLAKTKKSGVLDGKEAEFYNLDINIIFDNVFDKSKDGTKSLNSYVADFFDVLWEQVRKADQNDQQIHVLNESTTVTPTPYGPGSFYILTFIISFIHKLYINLYKLYQKLITHF